MNTVRNILCLAAVAMLCCSCVSRTVTRTPKLSETGKGKANPKTGKIVEKKIVWFWQDDF